MPVPAVELDSRGRRRPEGYRRTTEIVQTPIYERLEEIQIFPRPLSPRGREIFHQKALGLGYVQIAYNLSISEQTVKHNVSREIRKTGGSSFDIIAGTIRSGDADVERLSEGLEFERIRLLSDREREVLGTMVIPGIGSYDETIAAHLKITEKTVRNHISAILRKLNVQNSLRARVFRLLAPAHLPELPGGESEAKREGQTDRDFTPAEVRVLLLKAKGLTNEEIADQLVISAQTVKNYVTSANSKAPEGNTVSAIVKIVEADPATKAGITQDLDFEKYLLLSPEEKKVVDALAERENWGRVNQRVDHDLGISYQALRKYMRSIFHTLDLSSANRIRLKLFSIYLPQGIRDLKPSIPGVGGPLLDERFLDELSDQERALFHAIRGFKIIGRMSSYFSELGISNLEGWELLLRMLPKVGARNIGEIKTLQII